MLRIRRIPTIIGLFILLVGLGVGVFLVQRGQALFLRAGPETIPAQVKITNITENGFTVSWITDERTAGFIRFGETTRLGSTIADDRDQISGKTGSFLTHYVTVKNLKPQATYFFKLGSSSKIYDNNGNPYQIIAAPTINLPSPPNDVAYGKVVKQDGSPAGGSIVYLSLANITPQSILVQESGSWVIPLNLARSADLSSYATYDKEASIEEIFVQAAQTGTATAVTTTKYDNPVPKITLGKSFDFRKAAEEIEAGLEEEIISEKATEEAVSATPPASKFSFEPVATPAATAEELTIINPEEDERVNTQKPAIIGTGPAGVIIEITIESPAYSGTTTINNLGNWEWSPPADLEPGEHTATATYTDEDGQKHTVSHTFMVLAAGEEQPAFEATPSAEASPSPTPSPTPTPTATPAAREAMPSTEEGVPEPGNLTPTFFVFIIGLVLILTGFVVKI